MSFSFYSKITDNDSGNYIETKEGVGKDKLLINGKEATFAEQRFYLGREIKKSKNITIDYRLNYPSEKREHTITIKPDSITIDNAYQKKLVEKGYGYDYTYKILKTQINVIEAQGLCSIFATSVYNGNAEIIIDNVIQTGKKVQQTQDQRSGRDYEHIVLILGDAATGKTTLAETLSDHGYDIIKSVTTRPMRDRNDAKWYDFVSQEEFEKISDFVETNHFGDHYYGTRNAELTTKGDKTKAVKVIDPNGYYRLDRYIQEHFPKTATVSVLMDIDEKTRFEALVKEGISPDAAEDRISRDVVSVKNRLRALGYAPEEDFEVTIENFEYPKEKAVELLDMFGTIKRSKQLTELALSDMEQNSSIANRRILNEIAKQEAQEEKQVKTPEISLAPSPAPSPTR